MQTTFAPSLPSDPVALSPDSNIMCAFDPSPVRMVKNPATVGPIVPPVPCHHRFEPHPVELQLFVSGFWTAVHSLLPPPRDGSAGEFLQEESVGGSFYHFTCKILTQHTEAATRPNTQYTTENFVSSQKKMLTLYFEDRVILILVFKSGQVHVPVYTDLFGIRETAHHALLIFANWFQEKRRRRVVFPFLKEQHHNSLRTHVEVVSLDPDLPVRGVSASCRPATRDKDGQASF